MGFWRFDTAQEKFVPRLQVLHDQKLESDMDSIDGKCSLVMVKDAMPPNIDDFGTNCSRFVKLVISLLKGDTATDDELLWPKF